MPQTLLLGMSREITRTRRRTIVADERPSRAGPVWISAPHEVCLHKDDENRDEEKSGWLWSSGSKVPYAIGSDATVDLSPFSAAKKSPPAPAGRTRS